MAVKKTLLDLFLMVIPFTVATNSSTAGQLVLTFIAQLLRR